MATSISDLDLFGGTRPRRPKGSGGAASSLAAASAASSFGGGGRSSSGGVGGPLDPLVKKKVMGAVKSKGDLDVILGNPDIPQSIKDYARAVYKGQRKKSPNPDKSLWHAVTHNPLTDVVGGTLNLLPVPMRAIVATAEEGAQKAVGYEDGRSWMDKVRDPKYGVRAVIDASAERGYKPAQWVEQAPLTPSSIAGKNLPQLHAATALGLVGDIALDPLSYVDAPISAGTHGAAAVTRGEQALLFAEKAGNAASDAERMRYLQLADDVLKHKNVGAAALDEIGLKGGVRFAGYNTGIGADAVSKLTAPIRRTQQAGWRVLGNTFLNHIGADELRAARKAIHVGDDPVAAIQGLWDKHSWTVAKGRASFLEAQRTEELARAVRDSHAAGIDGKLLADALDGDAGAIGALTTQHPGVLEKFREWSDAAHAQLGLGERYVEDYFPRVLNQQVDTTTPAFRKLFGSKTPSPHQLTRLTNGDRFGEFILGSDELVKEFGPVVRHQMEGIWKQMGHDAPLFVDDAYEALPRYSHSINDTIQANIRFKYLEDRGVIVDRATETVPIKGAAKAEKSAAARASKTLRAAEKRVEKFDELEQARAAVAPHAERVQQLRDAQARLDEVAAVPRDPKAAKFLAGERRAAAKRLAEAERTLSKAEAEVARLEGRVAKAAPKEAVVPAATQAAYDAETALVKEQRGLYQDMVDVAHGGQFAADDQALGARYGADSARKALNAAKVNTHGMLDKLDAAYPKAVPPPSEAEVAAATRTLEDHLGVTEYNKAVKGKRSTEGINYTPLDQISADTLEKNAAYAEASLSKAQHEVDALQLAVDNGGGPATQAELRAAQVNLDTISEVATQQRAAAEAARVLERAAQARGPQDILDHIDGLAERLQTAEMDLEDAVAAREATGVNRMSPAERKAKRELDAVRNELRREGLPTDMDSLVSRVDELHAQHARVAAQAPTGRVFSPYSPGEPPLPKRTYNFKPEDWARVRSDWSKLGEDDMVRVYHAADKPENIRGLVESGKVDARSVAEQMRGTTDNRGIKQLGGLYVSLNPSVAASYGDNVISFLVPKRLIDPSSEVLWGLGELKIPGVEVSPYDVQHYGEMLASAGGDRRLVALLDGEGATLAPGTPLDGLTVHAPGAFTFPDSATDADRIAHAWMKGDDQAARLMADAAVARAERKVEDKVARIRQQEGLSRHLGTVAHKHRMTLGEELVMPEAPKAVQVAAKKYDELKPILDQAREAEALVSGDTKVVIAALQRRIDELDQAIVTAKNPSRVANLKEARAARDAARASLERSLGEDGPTVKFVLGLDAAASEAEAQMRESLATWSEALGSYVDAKNAPKFKEVFKSELDRGMALFPLDESKTWPEWMQQAYDQLVPISQSNKLIEGVDWFNRVFKAQATLSPGFHVRNAYSAVFMNMVHGVTLSEMRTWHKALTAYRKGGLEAVAESERELVRRVAEAGFLTSGTRWSHELSAMGEGRLTGHVGDFSAVAPQSTWDSLKAEAKGNLVTKRDLGDNPVNRVSNFAGVRVEQYARSVLAYHDLKAGASLETAWERVAHVHFDYTDLSSLESNVLKRLIPFWTWTSRNLPLQIESIVSKPKWYARFLAVKRNVELAAGPMDPLTPHWLQDGPANIRVGSDQWVTPDLPFAGAAELSRGLRDEGPLTLMQDVAPIFRLPFEAKARTQSFGDIPLSDKPVALPTAWLPLVPAIKAATGDSVVFKDRKSGEWQIAGDKAYMMESMFPLLGRARRLAPNDPKYQERAVQSWLGFMGFGSRKVTQRDREAATFQVADDLQSQVRWLENHGFDTRSAYQRSQDYRKAQQRRARSGG